MSIKSRNRRISVRIALAEHRHLTQNAAREHISVAAYARRALTHYLASLKAQARHS
jgi:predicted HicB family RNase H-like nuclease